MSRVKEQESAIDNFYKLKHAYDTKYTNDVSKIMNNVSLSDADKKERVKAIVRKCINCKRAGGTIFEISSTSLRARCDAEPRCNLNIEIDKGRPVIDAPYLLEILKDDLELHKSRLMSIKIQHALEMINDEEATEYFTQAKFVIDDLSREIAKVEEHIIELTNNIGKQDEIRQHRIVLFDMIQRFKDMLLRFNETGQDGFIRDAIRLASEEIFPKAKEIRLLKYKVNRIHTDDVTGIMRLIQEPYTLEEMTVPIPDFERV